MFPFLLSYISSCVVTITMLATIAYLLGFIVIVFVAIATFWVWGLGSGFIACIGLRLRALSLLFSVQDLRENVPHTYFSPRGPQG